MNLLLDTNVVIWMLGTHKSDNRKVGSAALRLIDQADVVYVSAISVVEVLVKSMVSKIKIPQDLIAACKETGLVELPVFSDHGMALINFPALAKHDPFDRILLAQARVEEVLFLTADDLLLATKLDFVKDARL